MYQTEIQTILSSFITIGLNEMDGVRLMNRCETKYVFSALKLPCFLDQLSGSYKILEIESLRVFPYHTLYLDTRDLLFYMQQVRGKLSRHKIRFRTYETTGLSFLEIKKKTNKNRTVKWRIESSDEAKRTDSRTALFIKKHIPYSLPELQPALINNFSRITLVGNNCNERITLDYNLVFENPDGIKFTYPSIAIAEVKREGYHCHSTFGDVMKKNGIRSSGFSKYCIGSALTKEIPRKNILKPNMLLINKIENEYIKSTGS